MTQSTTAPVFAPKRPYPTHRATVADFRGHRYLTINTIVDAYQTSERTLRVRLTSGAKGRGTWAEINAHIADAGLTHGGFQALTGRYVATLIPA